MLRSALTWQGLRQLDMMNVVGTYPAETEKFLASLTGLTCLRLRNDSLASKMPPMHCLSHLRGLQVTWIDTHCSHQEDLLLKDAGHAHSAKIKVICQGGVSDVKEGFISVCT